MVQDGVLQGYPQPHLVLKRQNWPLILYPITKQSLHVVNIELKPHGSRKSQKTYPQAAKSWDKIGTSKVWRQMRPESQNLRPNLNLIPDIPSRISQPAICT
ncbi:MAG: hypothetical protein ACI82I_000741 [Gammaproteobacteria bacterium]|jgi:hypothetical protein